MGWLFSNFNGFPSHDRAFVYGKWKWVNSSKGCKNACDHELLYDLEADLGERHDLSDKYPEVLVAIRTNFSIWLDSVAKSRSDESICNKIPEPPLPPPTPTPVPPPTPTPPPTPVPPPSPVPPSSECEWHVNTGLVGSDMARQHAETKEDCCGLCRGTSGCVAACHRPDQLQCHLKNSFSPAARDDGSIACVPKSAPSTEFVWEVHFCRRAFQSDCRRQHANSSRLALHR